MTLPTAALPFEQYSVEDHENPKYRCCCRCCHVTTGAIAIAVVEFVFVLFYALRGIVFLSRKDEDYTSSAVVSVIGAIVGLVILGGLLFGVLKQKKILLVPFLIAQIVVVLIQVAMAIVCIIYFFNRQQSLLYAISASDRGTTDVGASTEDPEFAVDDGWDLMVVILVSFMLAIYLLGAALGIWFFYVVFYCFVYFKDCESTKVDLAESVMLKSGINSVD